MTHPYGPASNPYGAGTSPLAGGNRPPLDSAASAAIAVTRARLQGSQPPPKYAAPPPKALSREQAAEASELLSNGGACRLCAGLHPGDELACPRLASFRLDGDGKVVEGTFFAEGAWDRSLIISAADAVEAAEEAEGDG